MDSRNGCFDFPRAHQRALVSKAVLPDGIGQDSIGVRAGVLKAVLKAIDDHGRGTVAWVSHQTIAAETSFSARQIRRAVHALTAMSLLCVERKKVPGSGSSKKTCNHYRIVFNELERLQPPSSPSHQVAFPADQVAFLGHQVALEGQQTDHPNRPRNVPPPYPPETSHAWAGLAGEFSAIRTIGQLCQQAAAAGLQPHEFRQAILDDFATADLPCNAGKLTNKAGAIAWKLRHGEWPVQGIVDISQWRDEQQRQAQAAERERQRQEQEAAYERQRWSEIDAGLLPDPRKHKSQVSRSPASQSSKQGSVA